MRRVRDAPSRAGPRLGPAAAALAVSLCVHGAALAFLIVFHEAPPEPGPMALVELVAEPPSVEGDAEVRGGESAAEGAPSAGSVTGSAAGAEATVAAAPALPFPSLAETPARGLERIPAEVERRAAAVVPLRPPRPPQPMPKRSEPARLAARSGEETNAGEAAPVPGRSASLSPPGQGGAGGGPGGSGASAPELPPGFAAGSLDNPLPRYPSAARRRGIEGTVTLEVLVSPAGLPERVAIARSSGSGLLDEAAVEAVRRWRFRPARRGSEAVEGLVSVPVTFRLVEAERAALP